MALLIIAFRVISRITDSVKDSAFSDSRLCLAMRSRGSINGSSQLGGLASVHRGLLTVPLGGRTR